MRRSDFLEHVGWTGAGILFTLGSSGLLESRAVAAGAAPNAATLSFVQISDSHIGFSAAANPDVAGTLKQTIDGINALDVQPAFVMHTGDVTHLAKPAQFDQAKQILSTLRAPLIAVPGEHDVIGDNGKGFLGMFGRRDAPDGWFSFDQGGVHFVALVNVFNFETMGLLGQPQLDWLQKDLAGQKTDTPIVVFGHVPLYALYPEWGWTTEDGGKALTMLRRFSRVTVLNGHIHQVIEHADGHIRFATAAATAYPQPVPGTAPKPGPVTLPHDKLLAAIGYRTVDLRQGMATLAQHALG
ncbi:MAG: metallophosphoesterase [Candidatus Eremiobacteraeota bacterium]|nr:metallophosphoesterase [Candidatus Eremiobacteraeota bacterium]